MAIRAGAYSRWASSRFSACTVDFYGQVSGRALAGGGLIRGWALVLFSFMAIWAAAYKFEVGLFEVGRLFQGVKFFSFSEKFLFFPIFHRNSCFSYFSAVFFDFHIISFSKVKRGVRIKGNQLLS